MKPPQSNNPCRDPFDDALDSLLSGETTPHLSIVLNDALRSDPEARRAYVQALAFEAILAREFAPAIEEPQAHAPARRKPRLAITAIAATVILAATLAWQFEPLRNRLLENAADPSDADAEITHAVITSLDEASGHFGGVPLSQGLRLGDGMLQLDSGLAEITFDSGAEVTLEGPARLQLDSDHKANLAAGRASANVPEPARGFVIHTPSSYIRDLGTAFAVEVHDNSETDLHVLEGEVEVSATSRSTVNPPHILRQREAVRLAAGSIHPIDFKADNPGAHRKPRTARIPPSVHWSFDSWDGSTTTDSTRGHLLKLQQKKDTPAPETIDGPFGLALHFDGQGSFARSDYPGVGGAQPRTVACWLRLQPGDSNNRPLPNGIIAWGVRRSVGKWQIAWNTNAGQGTVGAPRVEFGDGFAIGSTDLRDGRWHHLAVVYLGGPKANVATHVRIYVDGRLESLTGRRPRKIDTDTTSAAARPLMLGRHLGQTSGRPPMSFEGDLDEVYVFEGPLLPGQIERLMKQNNPRPGK